MKIGHLMLLMNLPNFFLCMCLTEMLIPQDIPVQEHYIITSNLSSFIYIYDLLGEI